MVYKISEIEGIGASYGDKLAAANIATTDDLLALCCDRTGRKSVSEKTGVSERQLLKWANMADLMRVSGIGSEYSELLEAAGVDTIKELRTRNPENLADEMKRVNDQKHLTRTVPPKGTVQKWVEFAKTMDPKITH